MQRITPTMVNCEDDFAGPLLQGTKMGNETLRVCSNHGIHVMDHDKNVHTSRMDNVIKDTYEENSASSRALVWAIPLISALMQRVLSERGQGVCLFG